MNPNDERKEELETLENLYENPYAGKTKDIQQTVFQKVPGKKSMEELNSLNQTKQEPEVPTFQQAVSVQVPKKKKESSKPVRAAKRSLKISFRFVCFLILAINIGWFLAVRFVIIPNFEAYNKESVELKEKIEILESRVKAITGE